MDKVEWVARCAARYTERSRMTPEEAYKAALVCFEQNVDGDDPEFMADEDMACWMDDL